MLSIAPIDYERYAVLVSPLEVPGVAAPREITQQREIEELTQTSSNLNRRASLARDDLETLSHRRDDQRGARGDGFRRQHADRRTDRSFSGLYPTDMVFPPAIFEGPEGSSRSTSAKPGVSMVLDSYSLIPSELRCMPVVNGCIGAAPCESAQLPSRGRPTKRRRERFIGMSPGVRPHERGESFDSRRGGLASQ